MHSYTSAPELSPILEEMRQSVLNFGQKTSIVRQAQNPYLQVLYQTGYYDGGTPYFTAKYSMWHVDPGGKMKDRFSLAVKTRRAQVAEAVVINIARP